MDRCYGIGKEQNSGSEQFCSGYSTPLVKQSQKAQIGSCQKE